MASKREKGKIAHAEWPAIVMRHQSGETLASIARSYDCTAPAIRYIVNREGRGGKGRGAFSAASATANAGRLAVEPVSGPPSAEPVQAMAGEEVDMSKTPAPATGSRIDRSLRERVNSDIAAFLVAFDAAFVSNSAGNRQALLDATDRLLRAGARTRIALERMAGGAEDQQIDDEERLGRRKAASGSARRK